MPMRAQMSTTVRSSDGTPLHVEQVGPERARLTVVLSHDWLGDCDIWPRNGRPSGVRVVRYDQRGHGRSGWGPLSRGRGGVVQLGQDLAAVVEATAPSSPLVLAGHSMGAMAVMAYAALYPEILQSRVAGVLLVAASAGPVRVDRRAARGRLPRNVAQGFAGALRAHDARLSAPALRSTRVAVLAPERDQVVPLADQLALARLIPGARLLSVPNAGHDVLAEAPDVVADELYALVEAAARGIGMPRQLRRK